MRYFFNLFLLASIAACTYQKTKSIYAFERIYGIIQLQKFQKLDELLDVRSTTFMNSLTNLDHNDYASIVALGNKYNFTETLVNYFGMYKKEIAQNNGNNTFYKFLGIDGAPLFDFQYQYFVNKKESRVQPKTLIAVYRKSAGARYVSWVRLNQEENKLKFDLIYTLQQHNYKWKNIYKNAYDPKSDSNRDSFFQNMIKTTNGRFFDETEISNMIHQRELDKQE